MAENSIAGANGSVAANRVDKIIEGFLTARGTQPHRHADVVFNNVVVEGSGQGVQAAPTVSTAALSFINMFNPLKYRPKQERSRLLLHEFSGTVKGGEMLLVIGKPGSGCTTFLKTMSGMHEEYKDTTGTVTYGGRPAAEVLKNRPADIVFCAEDDDHFPTLTVKEVLQFAVKSRWESTSSASKVNAAVDCLAKLVGLQDVLNTQVGNAYVRGVSGGQRRRVSLAEALATCAACVCLDNPTNGLDASTAFEFLQMMRKFTNKLQCATAMSAYQASDAMVSLFDKILVINNGRQIYYGEASGAKPYFESLGFQCAPTTTVSDFLTSMTAGPDARTARRGSQHRIPISASDFEDAFCATELWKSVITDVHTSKRQVSRTRAPKRASYTLSFYHQTWLCAYRQARIFVTDYRTWGIEAVTTTIQSVLLGTVFRNQQHQTSSFSMLESALFYAVLIPALQSMAEFQNTFAQQGLVLKHKRYRFYRPGAYAFGLIATDLVWKVFAIAYSMPLYWLANFQRTPGHFFTWFLTVYAEHVALSMIFRSLAVLSPNANKAILPVGLLFNVFVLYTGLYIPIPEMRNWLGWLRYLNPMYYAYESLLINEYSTIDYVCSQADLAPSGFGYDTIANQVCALPGSTPGQAFLSGTAYLRAQYGFETSALWRNIGINGAFFVAFAISTALGMEILRLPAGKLATVFYKTEPQRLTSIKNTSSSDLEYGGVDDEDVPPVPPKHRLSLVLQEHLSQQEENTFTWKGMCLDVKVGDSEKRLLDHVDGWVESGELTALMGVSGAGKTTLLNALAGRMPYGKITGDLLLNGQPLPKSFSRYMGYVQQQDVHLATQTVREALQLTAHLRQPAEIPRAEKDAYVELVIEMLEMEEFADALIGVPGAGLNLLQRRLVTIGVELAAKPDIMFLDEPSSGLDGQSAASMIRTLRKLADLGQAIVCTIHQPAADLMYHFDNLFLLTTGGKTTYYGPLGRHCSVALDYFSTYGRPCGERENPAEYFLDVIGAGSRKEASLDWAEIWQQSSTKQQRTTVLAAKTSSTDRDQLSQAKFDSTYGASFASQLREILHRTWLFYWREPDYASSKLWMHVGNAILNSITFLQSPDTVGGARNRLFSIFMALVIGPLIALQVVPRFITLRDIFTHREQASLTYNWAVFVVSAIVIELPYALFAGLIYWVLWYYPVGYFYETNRAGYTFLMFELFIMFATGVAQLSAAIMPSIPAAFTASGSIFMLLNTFTGTLSPEPVTPAGWRWFYNVSPLFYLSEGMNVNVLQDLQIRCTPDETSIFEPPFGVTCGEYARDFLATATGYLMNPEADSACSYCRYRDGQSYLAQYNYEWTNRYRNIGIFAAFIAFNYTFVILMTYLIKVRKWSLGRYKVRVSIKFGE